jgi:hypothetical protein
MQFGKVAKIFALAFVRGIQICVFLRWLFLGYFALIIARLEASRSVLDSESDSGSKMDFNWTLTLHGRALNHSWIFLFYLIITVWFRIITSSITSFLL